MPATSTSTAVAARPEIGRIMRFVLGGLAILAALAFLGCAGALVWALGSHRDASGYFTTATHHYRTSSYALTTESLNVSSVTPTWVLADRFEITATSGAPTKPLFVGIARTEDVDRYLARVAHDELGNISFDPFRIDYTRLGGADAPATLPETRRFWQVQAVGTGARTIAWPVRRDRWTAVVMNADGSRAVSVDAQLKVRFSHVWWLVGCLLALGALSLAGGRLLYRGRRAEAGRS